MRKVGAPLDVIRNSMSRQTNDGRTQSCSPAGPDCTFAWRGGLMKETPGEQ